VTKRGRCVGDNLQSRLRLRGGIIELSDDDEVSMASDEVGDDETSVEGVKQAAKEVVVMNRIMRMTMCGHNQVYKRKATTAS